MIDERRAETASRLRRLLPERRLTAQQVGEAAQVPPAIVRAFIDGADVPRVHYVRLRDWVLKASATEPPTPKEPRRGRPRRSPERSPEEQVRKRQEGQARRYARVRELEAAAEAAKEREMSAPLERRVAALEAAVVELRLQLSKDLTP